MALIYSAAIKPLLRDVSGVFFCGVFRCTVKTLNVTVATWKRLSLSHLQPAVNAGVKIFTAFNRRCHIAAILAAILLPPPPACLSGSELILIVKPESVRSPVLYETPCDCLIRDDCNR